MYHDTVPAYVTHATLRRVNIFIYSNALFVAKRDIVVNCEVRVSFDNSFHCRHGEWIHLTFICQNYYAIWAFIHI